MTGGNRSLTRRFETLRNASLALPLTGVDGDCDGDAVIAEPVSVTLITAAAVADGRDVDVTSAVEPLLVAVALLSRFVVGVGAPLIVHVAEADDDAAGGELLADIPYALELAVGEVVVVTRAEVETGLVGAPVGLPVAVVVETGVSELVCGAL